MLGDIVGDAHNYSPGQSLIVGLEILARMRHRATVSNEFTIDDWMAIKDVTELLATKLRGGEEYEAILVRE